VYKVQTYALARHAHYIEGKSQRQIATELGVNRRTIKKMLKRSAPPGYERTKPAAQPKLDSHKAWIDEVLESDKKNHYKQRHTALRIFSRLREELGFAGSYSTVRSYVASKRLKSKEMFVPLAHDPGEAQFDFGQADVIIDGQKRKANYLVMQLPFSDALFVRAYPAENTETFCDGHVEAFKFFGGAPKRILYDNTTIAVKKILGGDEREQTTGFTALKSHYLFTAVFAAAAKGNEKGGVENLVGYARRNFMVPLPDFPNFEALNEHLANCCRKEQSKIKRGHDSTISQRLALESFLPLPEIPYECCRIQAGHINSYGLVRFCDNDYSVPTSVGQQKVLIKGFVDRVVIIYQHKIIAEHPRNYGRKEVIFNPLHYLKLLERKTRAFQQAAPLKNWKLPTIFEKVHDILYRRYGKEGRRSYIRILQLLQTHSVVTLQDTLEEAVTLNVVNETAITHLLRRQVEGRPVNLSILSDKIPVVHVPLPNLSVYGKCLLSTGAAEGVV
jgi:transposase